MPAAPQLSFALNHMAAPSLRPDLFFELCRKVGVTQAEIRNDLSGNAIIDGTPAAAIGQQARDAGISLITINALQRFNDWNSAREAEAVELADYSRDAGVAALVLVPVNDGSGQADGERQRNLRTALRALKPILSDRGLIGLVEPLGFTICSLRSKREAAEAIDGIDGPFKLVHDTFHHHLAGEADLFPALMARFLLGEEPVSVSAQASVLVDKKIGELGDFDSVSVILVTASGKQCVISNSRRATYGYDQRIEVHGSKGMVSAENQRPVSIEVANGKGYTRPPLHDFFMTRYTEAYANEIASFIAAMTAGKKAEPSGKDGLVALTLADAALQSVKEGKTVRVG
jgi:predicted xylose isomerase-like sugar epimerase